jgi:hypothetical protein
MTFEDYEASEDAFQVSAMQYLRYCYPDILAFHVPNGGKRSAREGAKFKRQGVLAGVPDILIIKQKGSFSGFAIELKVKGGRLSPSQKERLQQFEGAGFKTLTTYSLDEFINEIDKYLKNE